MKIDTREIAEIAAAQPVVPRVDLYAGIHKALRAFMTDTLLGLGRMDVEDDLDFAQGCQRVAQLLDVLQAHLEHENRFVHPAIEARAQGGSLAVADEHEGHERAILRLVRAVADLMACARADRAPRAQALYHELALFVAQAMDVPLSFGQQMLLLAGLLLTSKGAAGVTGSGFVVLAGSLSAVGHIPVEGLALIVGIDRFMSEARAVTNFLGNAVATVFISRWERALDMKTARNTLGLTEAPPPSSPELPQG